MRKFKALLSIATAISISMPSAGFTAGTPPLIPVPRAEALVQMASADAAPVARDFTIDALSTMPDVNFPALLPEVDFNTHEIVIKSQPSIGELFTYYAPVYSLNLNGAETQDESNWASTTSFEYAVRSLENGLESAPATVTFNLPGLTKTSNGTLSGKAYEPITLNLSDFTTGYTQNFALGNSSAPCGNILWCSDFDFDNDSGVITITPREGGTYELPFSAIGYFWQSNESTVTINVADRAEPSVSDPNKTVTVPVDGTVDFDVAQMAAGEWDTVEVGNVMHGTTTQNGHVVTYHAPGSSSGHTQDYLHLIALDSVSGRGADIFITIELESAPVELPDLVLKGLVGQVFTQSFEATGGVAPYFYDLQGDPLPNGLAFSGNTISGTPTESGTYQLSLFATDANGVWVEKAYTLEVAAALALPPMTFNGKVGDLLSEAIFIENGQAPYSLSVTSGALPNGVSVSGSTLSGTPTESGHFAFDLTVTDAAGATATASYTLEIAAEDHPTVADATFDVPYGGSTTIDLATLITGDFDRVVVHVHPTTRGSTTVSGTVVTYTGPQKDQPYVFDDNFMFSVFTSSGYEVQATVQINLEAPAKPVATGFTVQTTRDQPVEFDLNDHVTAGFFDLREVYITVYPNVGKIDDLGNGRYRYTPASGVTEAETIQFEFGATDQYLVSAPATAAIEIAAVKSIQVIGGGLNAKVGQPFEHEIVVKGGVAPFTFTVLSGLPDGLALNGNKIEGTPTTEGNTVVLLQVVDSESTTGAGLFNLTVAAADAVVPNVANDATVSVPRSGDLYTFAHDFWSHVTDGDVWADIINIKSVSDPRVVVEPGRRGLPSYLHVPLSVIGTVSVEYSVTDINGLESNAGTIQFQLAHQEFKIIVEESSKPQIEKYYGVNFYVGNAPAPFTYTVTGSVPEGLTWEEDVNTGYTATFALRGTPTKKGFYTFTFTATDANGFSKSAQHTIDLGKDDDVDAPTAKNGALEVDYGQAGSIDLGGLTSGDVDAINIGNQPSKGTVKLDGTSAMYTPNEGETGTDQFTFTVTNAGGTATATVTVTIKEPLGEVPVAKDHVIRLAPVQSGSIDLTTGAVSKDPITAAHLISSVPASTGSAALSGTRLGFDPHKAFAGAAVVSYQLENKHGRSNIGKVTFVVAERPDPSKDPEVAALIKAQKDAGARLSFDQDDNITRRLEQIRGEAPGARQNSFDWQLGVDSKDTARYDHEGNEIAGQKSANARGSFTSENPLAGWTTGYIRLGETDFGSVDLKSTAVGGTAGLDYRFNDQFVGGVALGYGREATKIGEDGTENVAQAISGALYGTWHNQSGAFVDGILGFSHLTMDSSRYVTSTGDMAYGSRSGSTIFGSVVAGYRFETESNWKIEPYAGFRGVVGKLNGFSETGADWNNLAYGDTDIRSLKAVAGIRLEKEYETEDFLITPSFKAEYRHELAGDTTTKLGYADLGTMPYSVITEASESNSVVASVGVRVRPKDSNLSVEAAAQANMSGSGKPTMTYSVRANYEFCGIGAKKTDCMSREEKVTYYRDQLAKAERKKDLKKVAEFRKLLAEAEAKLEDWKKFSATLTPVPDFNAQFVDTISGPKPAKSKVQKPKRAKKAN